MSNLSSSEEVTQAVEEDHGVEEEQVDDYYDKLTHPFDPNKTFMIFCVYLPQSMKLACD